MATKYRANLAHYVSATVGASLDQGGPLYIQLCDLLTDVSLVAMQAAGIDETDDDFGEAWPWDSDQLHDEVAGLVVEAMFQAARKFVEAESAPVPA